MTPIPAHIKQAIEDKFSYVRCSDTKVRLINAASFGYSLADKEIERLKVLLEKLFKSDRYGFMVENEEKKWQQFKTTHNL